MLRERKTLRMSHIVYDLEFMVLIVSLSFSANYNSIVDNEGTIGLWYELISLEIYLR